MRQRCPRPDAAARRALPKPLPLRELPKGTVLWRVHDRGQACDQFVAKDGDADDEADGGRFDPLPQRKPVPMLYAASSPEAAIAESLVHVDSRGTLHPAARGDAERKAVSGLRVLKPLKLVAFSGLDVHRFPIRHRDLAECGQHDYPATRAWAALFRQHAAESQGIVWVSRQDNTSCSFVLWGDRVSEGSIEPQGRANPLYSGSGKRWLAEVLERMGTQLRED